jgi:hypothetical protein
MHCCICEKIADKRDTFIPSRCYSKHGDKAAHRICVNCWWNPTTGFALENASHKCLGCVKKLPLTAYKNESPIFIDLTDE